MKREVSKLIQIKHLFLATFSPDNCPKGEETWVFSPGCEIYSATSIELLFRITHIRSRSTTKHNTEESWDWLGRDVGGELPECERLCVPGAAACP